MLLDINDIAAAAARPDRSGIAALVRHLKHGARKTISKLR
jgi:hypothetical protein